MMELQGALPSHSAVKREERKENEQKKKPLFGADSVLPHYL